MLQVVHLAAELGRIRRTQGLTLAEAAERTGVSAATISRLERCDRTADMRVSLLQAYAAALGVELRMYLDARVPL
ncbi:helix-turn-helix domain-containing protein [Amycolatopsis nigrescens]|uniref:helix-turn-helix domain-containing protein n=1 Tax=Amycolatopsis nigrescens TaxID=381445 RepID=UPI0004774587|nr:helix-turn-helix transcriptional regulator [Amycolatopsis nigrescens]